MPCTLALLAAAVVVASALPSAPMTLTSPASMVPLDVGIGCGRGAAYPTFPTVVTFVINQPAVDLLLVHFDFVKLPPGDFLTVAAVAQQGNTSSGTAKKIETLTHSAVAPLFSLPLLHTSIAILELHVVASHASIASCVGFHVDGVRTVVVDGNKIIQSDESVCGGADDSKNAQCFDGSSMWTASKAVVRMVINRATESAFCTGWILGCGGHILTNQHCITNADEAAATVFDFMAEGATCDTNCETQGSCAQRPFVRGATLVATSIDLDYSLVKLGENVPLDCGFLQFRATGPVLHEDIYIPQHPMGFGKRVATMDGVRPGTITTLTLSGCAINQAGYMLDTQPGSSGAPVIATSDNKVVALHHCGGCPNAGIQAQNLIRDMVAKGVLPPCAVGSTTKDE
ncbi:Aste57867_2991 [Aphanomyces stellatus]|uniref:Aste57867_2991 protein n=1 Tax=Aphanomyces stellatus TaxID=120398 RepID=A0A485K8T9_9STRA|nr:hypothetical protein As57867_002982 [Aphanomyces stellatus]VFT80173.1 Aste57867_2991 [Aphanomyces stellatus]